MLAYLKTKDMVFIVPAVLGGILIDTDHLINYFFNFRRIKLKKLLAFPYSGANKVYLLFHSWELAGVVFFLAFFYQSLFWQVFAASFALHLLVDNLDQSKQKGFLLYFLSYRVAKGFRIEDLKGFKPMQDT